MNEPVEDSFALMQTLVQSRQQPIGAQLRKMQAKYSMLHEDVLVLIYHFGKNAPGNILEIGPYLGGSTIAAALGTRDSNQRKTLVTIEPGGQHTNPRLPSKNILRDLRKNIARQGVADLITIVEGHSGEEEIVAAVHEHLQPESVGLLILDADGGIDRDLRLYGDLLVHYSWVIIDDYYSPQEGGKAARIKPRVEALVATGQLQPLGLYGWGTWVGRWCRPAR